MWRNEKRSARTPGTVERTAKSKGEMLLLYFSVDRSKGLPLYIAVLVRTRVMCPHHRT